MQDGFLNLGFLSVCFFLVPYITFNWAQAHYLSPFSWTRIKKKLKNLCLGLGLLDFVVAKTPQSFHELAVSKLEDDACSEAVWESASFWLILFLLSCFKAV